MNIHLRSLFLLLLFAAILSAGYRYYRRLPPRAQALRHNEIGTWKNGAMTVPRFSRIAMAQDGTWTLGYYVRFTTESAYQSKDSTVTIDDGRLYVDGHQVLPESGKVLVLVRNNQEHPKLVELNADERRRYMNFTAGPHHVPEWESLWQELYSKAGS